MAVIKLIKAGKSKLSLKSAITYVYNEEKIVDTDGRYLVTTLNCWGTPNEIYKTMVATKRLYRKDRDGSNSEMYKHLQQAFKPGEVSGKIAHQLGVNWINKLWGDKGFEIVICTHLDKAHIHNHFIINSVNAITGKTIQIHANKTLEEMKALSDMLCSEQGLSVITRKLRPLSTVNFNLAKYYIKVEKREKYLWSYKIYDIINKAILVKDIHDYQQFSRYLYRQGIQWNYARWVGDIIFKDLNTHKSVTDKTLSLQYATDCFAIRRRLESRWGELAQSIELPAMISRKKQSFYALINSLQTVLDNSRKLTGVEWLHYLNGQGWDIVTTITGKAFYNLSQGRIIYDRTIYKVTHKYEYCLEYFVDKID